MQDVPLRIALVHKAVPRRRKLADILVLHPLELEVVNRFRAGEVFRRALLPSRMLAANAHQTSPILARVILVLALHTSTCIFPRVPGFVVGPLDQLDRLARVKQGIQFRDIRKAYHVAAVREDRMALEVAKPRDKEPRQGEGVAPLWQPHFRKRDNGYQLARPRQHAMRENVEADALPLVESGEQSNHGLIASTLISLFTLRPCVCGGRIWIFISPA